MPWYLNFSNILSLLLLPAGLALILWGGEENSQYGPWLLSYVIGSIGKTAGDVVGKKTGGKVPPAAMLLLLCTLVFFSYGCVGPTIPSDIHDLSLQVFERHDNYVLEDQTLGELDRRTYLRSTEILKKYLEVSADAAKQPVPLLIEPTQ